MVEECSRRRRAKPGSITVRFAVTPRGTGNHVVARHMEGDARAYLAWQLRCADKKVRELEARSGTAVCDAYG
ncbi:hypothetical protein GCM10020227_53880 [Streptomyces flavovirens]